MVHCVLWTKNIILWYLRLSTVAYRSDHQSLPAVRLAEQTAKLGIKLTKLNTWIYITLYYKPFISKALRYGRCVTMGSHSFTCQPHTNHTYLPLLPSRKASLPFSGYLLRLPTNGWLGWVDLGGWSHTEINVPHRELNPDTVTNFSTYRVPLRVTSLMCETPLSLCQAATANWTKNKLISRWDSERELSCARKRLGVRTQVYQIRWNNAM